jgi:uncharacterized protein (TIGR02996 family)
VITLVVDEQEHVFDRDRIWIGSDPANDLVIASARKRHAMITGNDIDGYEFHHMAGWRGTRINGVKMQRSSHALADGDRIGIGKVAVVYGVRPPVPYQAGEPAEHDLLAAIEGGDDSARLVYADWLEQRGDLQRADFLRVQHALMTTERETPAFHERTAALRALAPGLTLQWRQRLARPVVEGCDGGFEVPCVRDWSQLTRTERPDVRHCDGCSKLVYYSATLHQAIAHAKIGRCVAVDVSQQRRPYDLAPPLIVMGEMPAPRR